MKDITSTTFGLIIAFFLPGLSLFYSLGFWFGNINKTFNTFLTTQSNVGLFLLILAVSVILSLQITLIRWLIYEYWLCRKYSLSQSYFENLSINENKLVAFRAVIDEHYRYHQFWGSISIVLPIFTVGFIKNTISSLSCLFLIIITVLFLFMEFLTGWAAIKAYKLYNIRATKILK